MSFLVAVLFLLTLLESSSPEGPSETKRKNGKKDMPQPNFHLLPKSLKRIQGLERDFQVTFNFFFTEIGNMLADLEVQTGLRYSIYVTHGVRSYEEQRELYGKGRWLPGKIVTHKSGEPGDESRHQIGEAADYVLFGPDGVARWGSRNEDDYEMVNGLYEKIGRIAEAHGLVWGGRWKFRDIYHVQKARP